MAHSLVEDYPSMLAFVIELFSSSFEGFQLAWLREQVPLPFHRIFFCVGSPEAWLMCVWLSGCEEAEG